MNKGRLTRKPGARGLQFGLWSVAVASAAVIGFPREMLGQGCAMCATYINGPNDPLAKAMNASILFLLSMPFVLFFSISAWFFYMHRRGRHDRPVLRVLQMEREEGL